ncbi:MAG: hypothetical protein HWE27_07430 [Gammaproteobacteria bacterium]|nr:hypothetical protein [Gammaproteobacteria bacterium]
MNRRSRKIMVPKKGHYYWLEKARDKVSDEATNMQEVEVREKHKQGLSSVS